MRLEDARVGAKVLILGPKTFTTLEHKRSMQPFIGKTGRIENVYYIGGRVFVVVEVGDGEFDAPRVFCTPDQLELVPEGRRGKSA